ncbi:MAG: hypothetical protein JZD41_03135 [Thermoproteus sp.]|nr:hypothetical protein [Thermoproteus sp.]
MVEILALREVDDEELKAVAKLVEEFGPPPVELVVALVDDKIAEEAFGISGLGSARLITGEGHYTLLVRSPDKFSIWRELAFLEAMVDPRLMSIWSTPEQYRNEGDALALSLALLNRVADFRIALRDVKLLTSSFSPGDLPVDVDDLRRSLIYTLALDVTVSAALAGFSSLAEELYLKYRQIPLKDIYTRFRNFVINNFKFEPIYNYLLLLGRPSR